MAADSQRPGDVLYFYGHRNAPYGEFSNFFASELELTHECIGSPSKNHWRYPTAEHAIMHIKATLMGDTHTASLILEVPKDAPMKAKKLGRKVKPFHQRVWDAHVERIAYAIVFAKFSQNASLGDKLKQTGNKVLAEAAPNDKIWGIGLDAKSAKTGAAWAGLNILGNALMEVRKAIQ
jgi:hypothetical protein